MNKIRNIRLFIIATLSLVACHAAESESDIKSKGEQETPTHVYSLSFVDGEHTLEKEKTLSLSTKLLCDGEEINNYSLSFSSLDNTIARVDKNGVVTALGEGETKIKAIVNEFACDPAFYDIGVFAKHQTANILNEKIVNYYGRVLKKDNRALLFNTGSGFEIGFYGTTLSASFDDGIGQKLRIFVDGEDKGIKDIASETLLCSSLEEGLHTLKAVRANYEYRGVVSLAKITGASYYLTAPKKPETKFEFIGDSITAGYGVNADGSGDSISNEDGTITYAYQTMLNYKAQGSFLCYSGVSVALPLWVDWTVPERYSQYSFTTEPTKWDFSKYTPDYVVINLGTNDSGKMNSDPNTSEALTRGYLSFLRTIRNNYEKAIIICCYGMMGVQKETSLAISNAVMRTFDQNIHYLEFTPVECLGHNGHPNKNGQTDGANQLISFIDSLEYNDKPITDNYEVSEVDNFQFKESCSTYAIRVTKETNSISVKVDIGKADQRIIGGITVKEGNAPVHISAIGVDEWFKTEEDNTNTYRNMGSWMRYSDVSDDTNYVYLKASAKDNVVLAIGTTIYLSFTDYHEPELGEDYSIVSTTDKVYEDYDIYKIEILKENEGFVARITTDLINKRIDGAIMVCDSERWVSVETTNYGKWFRANWNTGDWWRPMNEWDRFGYTTGDDGIIELKIGIYTADDVNDCGPLVSGVKIYVAAGEKTMPSYSINTETTITKDRYNHIYRIDIVDETAGFTATIPNIGNANERIRVVVRIDDGGEYVFYQPTVGGCVFQWITGPANTGGWANVFGEWFEGLGDLDENGNLIVEINDYLSNPFTVGAKIFIGVEIYDPSGEPFIVREATEKTYQDGYTVYAVEVVEVNDGNFTAKIHFGNPNTPIEGAFTAGGTYLNWLCIYTKGIDNYKFFHPTISYGGGWSLLFGEWYTFESTTDEKGDVTVLSKRYEADVGAGAIFYIALREKA